MGREKDRAVPEKTCLVCGRRMTWRKSWARNWETVAVCGEGCRKRRGSVEREGRALEAAILDLLEDRAHGATICPSEAARAIDLDGWRKLLEPTREAARRLVARGEVVIVQGGRIVDPSHAKGPIRIRRAARRGGR